MRFQFENSMAKSFNAQFGETLDVSQSEITVNRIYKIDDSIFYEGDLCAINGNNQIIGFYKYKIKCYLVVCPEEAEYSFEEDLRFKNPMA